ncbi:glycoside hydrolase family 3 N-terminal domain-containing protein [Aestuariimicrobium sp. T2.26MG-19.2B]|uniref:glycoside hydrolase family 3 N-terminal domain-containing protein n=1 Tax=Aestuariimicrobium sp. T2.26MG-19.2B TaxID=3040679 RepID=UPI002477992E|nr:glycoside hydrolase family 3 N-terminal domain-containing protein [Aestuariimicrobium sp. T2.26MG-19.2B]CAI9399648.1 Beta-xylosidase [Aestuariimicrobium sp. T2.26MG-19.2B]
MTDLPYRDPSLSVEARVEDLLARLTVEEKAGQLTQYFYFGAFEETANAAQSEQLETDADAMPLDASLFSQQPTLVEQALSVGGAGSLLFVKDAANANRLQRMAIDGNRHGIPVIFGFDVIHGFRTIMPVPIAVAASWDPEVAEAGQSVAAREASAVGIRWTFAPMLDIARDPRWGRIVEGAGEDPVLGAAMAAAQVRGFQGDLGPERIVAGPKHFAGYGAARGGRDYDDSDISDSELRNVYLPPFKAAVEAGAGNIMSAYMDLNGTPAVSNSWLLTEVLRDEWGFAGFVVSDANGVRSQETQHHVPDLTEAAVRALNAGNDMEMCMFDPAFGRIPEAVEAGRISVQTLDESVRRVLRLKFELGLFENPYVDEDAVTATLDSVAHREVARSAAERSAVLLKNDDAALPLSADGLSSIAVIGQLADSARDTVGPWVFDQDNDETVTILAGVRALVGEGVRVEHANGASIPNRLIPSMFERMDKVRANTPEGYDDDAEIERAVSLAASADVAIVVVGQRQNQIGEAASTSTLELAGRQTEQLRRIAETGTRLVVVSMSGRPLDLRGVLEVAPAVLHVWYPGTRGGEAVANLLFGRVSPAGRLPFTWPRHVGQVPMVLSHYRTFQPESQAARYWDDESTPLFGFGHGLSYASFEYSDLRVEPASIAVGQSARVSVEVTNTSDVDADEVVQLYIHQRYGTSTRPIRELKGFERVAIPAGTSTTVSFDLGPDQLRYWSGATRDWVQDATTIEVHVGGSSRTALEGELTVTA